MTRVERPLFSNSPHNRQFTSRLSLPMFGPWFMRGAQSIMSYEMATDWLHYR